MNDTAHEAGHEAGAYHLGTSDDELERLGFQHQVWQQTSQDLWTAAGFGPGDTLLDLGCGPGFATLELARLVRSEGRVHAIDASARFVEHLRRTAAAGRLANIDARTGDVHALDLPDSSVDGAFARWLLCFLNDPGRACAEVARVLRPGGAFVAWDYCNYLAVNVFPERPAIRRLFQAYYRSSERSGGSYDVGNRLPGLLLDCGLEIGTMMPIQRLSRPDGLAWKWVSSFHRNYVPKLVQNGLLTATQADECRAAWADAEQDPASYLFTPPMIGIVARKPR